jgi:hypothetical protein
LRYCGANTTYQKCFIKTVAPKENEEGAEGEKPNTPPVAEGEEDG